MFPGVHRQRRVEHSLRFCRAHTPIAFGFLLRPDGHAEAVERRVHQVRRILGSGERTGVTRVPLLAGSVDVEADATIRSACCRLDWALPRWGVGAPPTERQDEWRRGDGGYARPRRTPRRRSECFCRGLAPVAPSCPKLRCAVWLVPEGLGPSVRRDPRGRMAARRVATGRHRSDGFNVGVGRPIVKPRGQSRNSLSWAATRPCRNAREVRGLPAITGQHDFGRLRGNRCNPSWGSSKRMCGNHLPQPSSGVT